MCSFDLFGEMKGPEPWDIFGLYAEERWSITVSGKERDKNYELKKQADKGRVKQSQLFKLKKKRWWGEGKKVNKSLLWRGESKSSPDDGWQKWKWVYTTARMLHTIILFSSMRESPGKDLVEIMVPTQTCIKKSWSWGALSVSVSAPRQTLLSMCLPQLLV